MLAEKIKNDSGEIRGAVETMPVGINGGGAIGIESLIYSVALGQPVVQINELQGRDYIYHQLLKNWWRISGMQIHHDKRVFKIADYEVYKEGKNNLKLAVQIVEEDPLVLKGKTETYWRLQTIPISSERNPENCNWGEFGDIMVNEATGSFTDVLSEEHNPARHLIAGAKHVTVSAPPKHHEGLNTSSVVLGVNDDEILDILKREINNKGYNGSVVFNESCTTNSISVLIKGLEDNGIKATRVDFTTTHAATPKQRFPDSSNNIEIFDSGARNALPRLFNYLNLDVSGEAFRVPISDGSLTKVYLTCLTDNIIGEEQVNEILRAVALNEDYQHRVFVFDEEKTFPADLSMVKKREYSAIVDLSRTKVSLEDIADMEEEPDKERYKYKISLASFYPNRTGPAVLLTRSSILIGRALEKMYGGN